MQTRRSSKATAPAPSSPPAHPGVRRNPPRATRRQEIRDVGRASSSDLSPTPPSSPPSAILQKWSLPPSHPSGARPSSPPPLDSSASVPPPSASPAMPGVELPKGLTSVPRKGSLVYDPKPRRGAPRRTSGSSLRISPERNNSDDEPSIPPKTPAELEREEMVLRDIKDAEHQLKVDAIDSLARDARNVIGQLQDKSRPSYKEVLAMKMQAFEASRGIFLAPGQAFPFLGYDWLKDTRLKISETTRATLPLAVKLANIATALSHMERVDSNAKGLKSFLDALDANFPRNFAAEEDKQYLSLSLEIRTQRAIERIASSADGIDKRTELSWVFCPTEPGTGQAFNGGYPELFKKGPYRPLAGLDAQTLVDVCSDRVERMWKIMSDSGTRAIRSPMNLTGVRKEFPLSNMLHHLKNWLMDRFQSILHSMAKIKQEEVAKEEMRLLEQLRKEEAEERRALEEELRAREEALAQQKRRQQDQEQERIRREREAREDRSPETRRQQQDREQERVRNGAKAQEERHSALPGSYPSPNADEGSWAGESSPESIRSSEPTPRRILDKSRSLFSTRDMVSMLNASSLQEQSTSESSRKRPNPSASYEPASDSDEPDNDDGFKVGPRPHKKGKTASSSTIVCRQPLGQRRSPAGDPSQDDNDSPYADNDDELFQDSQHDAPQEQQGHIPRQRPRESQRQENHPAAPPSSAPDYAALRHAKEVHLRVARLNKPRPHQQRHPWSEEDSNTLIELIATRAASWAEIYKSDNAKFEHPRNAQAYRDKARNLKVDFLVSDAPLPRGFDQVALSHKEMEKVRNAGKNPYRREGDVDRYGRPTNTAYIP